MKKPVPDYAEYVRLQKEDYCSYESQNKHWSKGQKRYIKKKFSRVDRDKKILDIACGDGVGLKEFKKLGFENVTGVEFNKQKADLARETGYEVHELDMHNLTNLKSDSFDIVYSSHTLEHAYKPGKALQELHRVLKKGGLLLVVLPYPDLSETNVKAHVAKFELGTNKTDGGKSIVDYFQAGRFHLLKKEFDKYREPEIWLTLSKD